MLEKTFFPTIFTIFIKTAGPAGPCDNQALPGKMYSKIISLVQNTAIKLIFFSSVVEEPAGVKDPVCIDITAYITITEMQACVSATTFTSLESESTPLSNI